MTVLLPAAEELAKPVLAKVILFDGDDTLWVTEPLYDGAREEAARIVASAGLDADHWEGLQRETDIKNFDRFGLSADRFPTSCVEAYEVQSQLEGRPVDPRIGRRIQAAAASVFTQVAPLAPGAASVLNELKRQGHTLVLYTQGDPEVQKKRVADSGLGHFFAYILVVPHKTPEDLRLVAESFNLDPGDIAVVGNSLRSDIEPSLAAGMTAVWIDAHVWEKEHRPTPDPHEHLRVATQLTDLLGLFTI